MGNAPPCRSFDKLRCMCSILQDASEMHACDTKEDIDATVQRLKPARDALSELVSNCKPALKGLQSFVTAARAAGSQQRKSTKEKQKAAASSKYPLFDFALEHGTQINIICEGEQAADAKFTREVPFIIKCGADGAVVSALRVSFASMEAKFEQAKQNEVKKALGAEIQKASAAKKAETASKFRAQRPLQEDAITKEALEWMASLVPSALLDITAEVADADADQFAALKTAIQVSSFGVAACHEGISIELGMLPTMRVGFKGTRVIVAVKMDEVLQLMEANKVKPGNMAGVKQFVGGLNQRAPLPASYPSLYVATVTALDALWMPLGFIIAEKAAKNTSEGRHASKKAGRRAGRRAGAYKNPHKTDRQARRQIGRQAGRQVQINLPRQTGKQEGRQAGRLERSWSQTYQTRKHRLSLSLSLSLFRSSLSLSLSLPFLSLSLSTPVSSSSNNVSLSGRDRQGLPWPPLVLHRRSADGGDGPAQQAAEVGV